MGIEVTPYLIARADSSSVLSFTIFNLSPCSFEISSKIGATARQGPHHSAQKSTKTGIELFYTTSSKFAAVTDGAALIFALPLYSFFVCEIFRNRSSNSSARGISRHLERLGSQSLPQ